MNGSMTKERKMNNKITAIALLVVALGTPYAEGDNQKDQGGTSGHVLLISIDGMHALDYENCVKTYTCPTLAKLGQTGVNYTQTSTPRPSDSFPGLMALVTGGTPKTVGGFYDVAYDRVLAPPSTDTHNSLSGGNCNGGHVNGTRIEYEEGVDYDPNLL